MLGFTYASIYILLMGNLTLYTTHFEKPPMRPRLHIVEEIDNVKYENGLNVQNSFERLKFLS